MYLAQKYVHFNPEQHALLAKLLSEAGKREAELRARAVSICRLATHETPTSMSTLPMKSALSQTQSISTLILYRRLVPIKRAVDAAPT